MSRPAPPPSPIRRWLCPCQPPGILLATVQPDGTVNIKVRDRYYQIVGAARVRTTCPRCGQVTTLDPRPPPAQPF
jgi:hypothetical protein